MLEHLSHAVGHALRGVRAGLEQTTFHEDGVLNAPETIDLFSLDFADGETLPALYTQDGERTSPPLTWRDVPTGARSLVLVVEDADSPTPAPVVHTIAWNLPAREGSLTAGALNSPGTARMADGSPFPLGLNSFRKPGWLPPDPPRGHGPHRYEFQIFALDRELDFSRAPGRDLLVHEMRDHVIGKGALIGVYERA